MTETAKWNDAPHTRRRRKLRPLVITMGSTRQDRIRSLFSEDSMADRFEPPAFSPGVPSRSLRNRLGLLRFANEAGILPPEEWDAVRARGGRGAGEARRSEDPERLFDRLSDVPVRPGRRGSEADAALHYSVELWRKAKGLSRGRSVLACALAHLIAMRKLVEDGYDFILEDNVRCPVGRPHGVAASSVDNVEEPGSSYCECAERIWDTIEASDAAVSDGCWGDACHLRYYGWLGSLANLEWVIKTHAERTSFRHGRSDCCATVFPFPVNSDIDMELLGDGKEKDVGEKEDVPVESEETGIDHRKPGGTLLWGSYAYWISRDGLDAVLSSLRVDVGALLWKGKRMRCHTVKPIDKVMPRRVMELLGRDCIHVTTAPAFFRAPMLTSSIHTQWDAEFCRSTEYQMGASWGHSQHRLDWGDLWLTKEEREIVMYKAKRGIWLTMADLSKLKCKEESMFMIDAVDRCKEPTKDF